MRMDIDKREVTVTGNGTDIKVRIASNAKAFKALIDKLYSDKPRAVVRELWSNALDAHVAVGTPDRPFHTHIPTPYEPWFSVRDFGPGMDAKFVEGLYSTVFESTKDQDNVAVGKWGLGSKSPWSYTDAFTVTCYDGTTMRVYTAYIDENQFPNFKLLLETASTEPRGVEVKVPVKREDIALFNEAAERVAIGFDVKPIGNIDKLPVIAQQATRSGDGWYYINNENAYRNDIPEFDTSMSYIWQGCVLYPIDTTLIKNTTVESDVILGGGFIIRVPIGAVDINPAREGLSYDKQTIAYIEHAVSRISSEIIREYQAQIDEAKTYHAACKTMCEILNGFSGSSIKRILRNRLIYRGKALTDEMDLSVLLSRYLNMTYENGGMSVMFVTRNVVWGRSNPPRMRGYTFAFNPYNILKIGVASQTVVVWEDPNATIKTYARRYEAFFTANPSASVLWVRCNRDCMAFKRLLVTINKQQSDVVDLSSLEYTKNSSDAPKRMPVMAKYLVDSVWSNTTVDVNDAIIYVPLNRGKIVEHSTVHLPDYSMRAVSDIFERVKGLTGDTQKYLIGVPKTLNRLIKKGETWRDLRDVIADLLLSVPKEVSVYMTDDAAMSAMDSNVRAFFKVVRDRKRAFKENTYASVCFKFYCELQDRIERNAPFFSAWNSIFSLSNAPSDQYYTLDTAFIAEVERFGSAVGNAFPMLRHVDFFRGAHALTDTINYVNTISGPSVDLRAVVCDTNTMPDAINVAA